MGVGAFWASEVKGAGAFWDSGAKRGLAHCGSTRGWRVLEYVDDCICSTLVSKLNNVVHTFLRAGVFWEFRAKGAWHILGLRS